MKNKLTIPASSVATTHLACLVITIACFACSPSQAQQGNQTPPASPRDLQSIVSALSSTQDADHHRLTAGRSPLPTTTQTGRRIPPAAPARSDLLGYGDCCGRCHRI
jgi:hypothetical protein